MKALGALYVLIFAVCIFRYEPPAGDAPLARRVQAEISPGASRVVGSEANDHAREVLKRELEASGFTTEIQSALSCGRWGSCAYVKNLIAKKPGTEAAASAVLLMAHLDSVWCSPGAGDDGFGAAAVIDAAHALGTGAPLKRTLIVLLTDAEEPGLLGAEAFMRGHPLASQIVGVVNLDSRGSSGPSAMFETTPGNAWLVDVFAKASDHPVTSSLFYEAYRRMPNDTDFTVVKSRMAGLNLANVGQVERYHTALDDVAHADPRTLAQHAAQAQALTRALANAGPELTTRQTDAVWFDVLALFVVRWPVAWSLPLAVAAFALVLGWTIRRRAFAWRGLLAPLGTLIAATLLALLLGALLHGFGALPVSWIAVPLPALLSLHLACFAIGLVVNQHASWSGIWLLWSVLGIVVAAAVPGACFLFVVPALVAGVTGGLREDLRLILPSVAAAIVWLPLVLLVYQALGLAQPVVVALPSIVLVTTWPYRLPRRELALIPALAFVVALFVPKFSIAVPQRVNVVYRQDHNGARVYLSAAWGPRLWGDPPFAMLEALGRETAADAPLPWMAAVPEAAVPSVPTLVGPHVEKLAPGRFHITSPRGARNVMLLTDASTVTVDGTRTAPTQHALLLRGIPEAGVTIELTAKDLTVLDLTSGVPSESPIASAVVRARPATAVATQDGDLTVVATELVP